MFEQQGEKMVFIFHSREHAKNEAEKKAKNEKLEQLEIDLNLNEKLNLENSKRELEDLQENHRVSISTLNENESIISKLLHTENSLINRAKELVDQLAKCIRGLIFFIHKPRSEKQIAKSGKPRDAAGFWCTA